MSVNVGSARNKQGYFGQDFLDQSQAFGGEPKLYGPWYDAVKADAVTMESALAKALTSGFLDRRQANFTPGWVVTLTLPKDWALAVNATFDPAEAKRLNAIVHEAAEAVLRPYAEHPVTRLGAGGKDKVRGDGLWFVATELLNRNGDLHPHAHAVVFNAVRCPDGRWRSHGSARELYADQSLLNARFMKLVADRVQRTYGLDLARKESGFTLTHFPHERVRAASSRTAEIDALCRANGWTKPEQRQIAAYLTRPDKREFELAERWQAWKAETRATVLDIDSYFGRTPTPHLGPNQVAARAAGHALDAARSLDGGHGPFTSRHLLTETALRAVGDPGVRLDAVERAAGRVLERPDLFGLGRIDRPRGGPLYFSKESVRTVSAANHRAERVTPGELVDRIKAGAAGVVAATAAVGQLVLAAVRRGASRDRVIELRGDLPAGHPRSVSRFVRRLKPVSWLDAHKDALKRGLLHSRGTLPQRLEQAERLYRQNRRPKEQLHARQVVVVTDPDAAPRESLAALERLVKKANASLVYADTPHLTRPPAERDHPGRKPETTRERDRT